MAVCAQVRSYLSKRLDSSTPAGAQALAAVGGKTRTPAASALASDQSRRAAACVDASLEMEVRLERLLTAGAAPRADDKLLEGTPGCWDRVMTRTWHEPASEARPDSLKVMRTQINDMRQHGATAAGFEKILAGALSSPPKQQESSERVTPQDLFGAKLG